MKTRSLSRSRKLSTSPLTQLDGAEPESEPDEPDDGAEPEPEPEPEPKPKPKPNPNPEPYDVFGYCSNTNCSVCPKTLTPEKFGGYIACFPPEGDDGNKESCKMIHAHSRNSLCTTYYNS